MKLKEINMSKKFVVALDIGGTKIEGMLVDSDLKIIRKKRIYFRKKSLDVNVKLPRKDVLNMICSFIDSLKQGNDISSIGISYPDVILPNGIIFGSSKIVALNNYNLAKYLSQYYRKKCCIMNDADCFVLAEQRMGAGLGYKNVVGVIIGSGVGSGIILNGKVYPGSFGSAGEFGHIPFNPKGPEDRMGYLGTIEAYVGGSNFVQNYKKSGGEVKNASPKEIFNSREKAARLVVENWFKYLGIGLAFIFNFLNPEIIVLGGGQSNLSIYREINKIVKTYVAKEMRSGVKIVKNKIGDSAGIYGAAILAFYEIDINPDINKFNKN